MLIVGRVLLFLGMFVVYFFALWWSLQLFSFETLINIIDALNFEGIIDGIVACIILMVTTALALAGFSLWLIKAFRS